MSNELVTPEIIKEKSQRLLFNFLNSEINHGMFFPKEIRCNKGDFSSENQKLIYKNSKVIAGVGYSLKFKTTKKVKLHMSNQTEISKIFFETKEDFLKYLNIENNFKIFQQNISNLVSNFSELETYVSENYKYIWKNPNLWGDMIKVCHFFKNNPNSNLYIRQLSIKGVSTKFIEDNKPTLTVLLKIILNENFDSGVDNFEDMFGLKAKNNQIRFRFLDSDVMINNKFNYMDIGLLNSDFENLNLQVKNIFVVENEITFLTFPFVENSIVIFGKGFGVAVLKKCAWLSQKNLFYWGDLDSHGFQILSMFRKFHESTKSILMDDETFDNFKEFEIVGENINISSLDFLTMEELGLFYYFNKNSKRIEQERISIDYVKNYLKKLN